MSLLNKVTSKLPGFGDGQDYYLSLVVTYKGVEAALWRIDDGKLVITETVAIAFDTNAKILDTAADAIDQVCEKANVDVRDVILGLPDYWISQNQILPQYLDKLKELAENLDIAPFAFVAQNHSVANRLKVHFGTTVSGFLLHVDQNNFTLSSIQNGQLQQTRFIQQGNNETAASCLQKLFAHFSLSSPAPTVYVYSSVPLTEPVEETIQSLGIFANGTPQVIMLDNLYALQAICLAGAIDRGKLQGIHIEDISDSPLIASGPPKHHETPQHVSHEMVKDQPEAVADAPVDQPSEWAPFNTAQIPLGAAETASATELAEESNIELLDDLPEGFSADGPDEEATDQEPEKESKSTEPPAHAVPEHAVPVIPKSPAQPAAFATAVANPPIAHNTIPFQHNTLPTATQSEETSGRSPFDNESQEFKKLALPSMAFLTPILAKIKAIKPGGGAPETAVATKRSFGVPKKPVLIGILLLVVAGLFGGALVVSKANVTLAFSPKPLEGDMTVLASSKVSQIDIGNKKIPIETVTTEVSGDVKGSATGKKKVGDKAKGTVTLLNKTAQAKSFAKGTVLQADSLSFVLTDTASVPAYSATDSADGQGQIIKFGKATVAAEASDIGPESNIAGNTPLTVKGQSSSSVTATTATAFTGGTAKDVTVVSDADIKNAEAEITKQLQEQAKTDVLNKVGSGKNTVSDAITVAITKKTTSKKAQDEAKEFTISATAKATALVYNAADFKTLLTESVKDQLPTGFELYSIDEMKQPTFKSADKNGEVTFAWHYLAQLAPKINPDEIKQAIKNKSIAQAKDYLRNMPNTQSVTIAIEPKPLSLFGRMPVQPNNIAIQTEIAP